ncbi:Arrestin domain-containing protein 2 [Gamsiella multidivaricata]|nr:Arrestin domain-containing protein 2 [Gamsiella multidivaricata]
MNFLFAANSPSTAEASRSHALACSTAMAAASAADYLNVVSPTTSVHPHSLQDIELVIEIESSFNGVLVGLPEESQGAVLNATAILHVRKKPIRASKLTATFDGRIKVQCSDGATFGSEQYRERVLAHKDWILWEAGGANLHSSGSGSKNHIPVGSHYYPLSIQLDGALPPTFSGKHGSIRYILSSTLLRPLFYSDINALQEIEIKRCLVSEPSGGSGYSTRGNAHLDLGSLLVNQLSRVGISGALNEDGSALGTYASELPLGPTTITHHNTHKELLRYTASSPPIAHLEGGIVRVDLTLEPLPPGSYIYSIAYGLKEMIYYRSSATGNLADNKSEILYPLGQQTVIIPRDQERERSMSSAGAGASTRQLLELRPCPLLTNVDITTPLIEIQHRITCNVAIVLPELMRRRNIPSGNRSSHGVGRGDNQSEQSGGGILRRLNLTPQPLSPCLNLVDSTGTEVVNNAVLLGELTHSIIEPALVPATVELNDAPPPPPCSQLQTTVLEFPIILTSRYPSPPRTRHLATNPIAVSQYEHAEEDAVANDGECAYQTIGTGSYSSSYVPSPAPPIQQFVHNQEISSAVIPTTGTTIQTGGISTLAPALSGSFSSSPLSTLSSIMTGRGQDDSSSSSQVSPSVPATSQDTFTIREHVPRDIGPQSSRDMQLGNRAPAESGISAGLRAAAAAAANGSQPESESSAEQTLSLSRPPSYGRQIPQQPLPIDQIREEPPKYEDVIDISERLETGLGISMPHSMPMPMPMQVSCRGYQSTSPGSISPRSFGASHSPILYQSAGSYQRGPGFASPSSPSPISPFNSGVFMNNRDGQGSSPQAILGGDYSRPGSTPSILLSTSLARSQGRSMSTLMAMSPIQSVSLQPQFSAQPSVHRQTSVSHQRQHQRQRSIGAATIMGSLGCNGGYLSQQPAPLALTDFSAGPPLVAVSARNGSPPAYADV